MLCQDTFFEALAEAGEPRSYPSKQNKCGTMTCNITQMCKACLCHGQHQHSADVMWLIQHCSKFHTHSFRINVEGMHVKLAVVLNEPSDMLSKAIQWGCGYLSNLLMLIFSPTVAVASLMRVATVLAVSLMKACSSRLCSDKNFWMRPSTILPLHRSKNTDISGRHMYVRIRTYTLHPTCQVTTL